MTKERGFLEFARRDPEYRPVEERVRDFRAVEAQMPEDAIVEQANRCMDCGTPFCHGCGCPLANVIPEFNDAVYRRRWGRRGASGDEPVPRVHRTHMSGAL